MVKFAYEDIVDSFEKEAANRFFQVSPGGRGSYGNGATIASKPSYNENLGYGVVYNSSYPGNHIMTRALRTGGQPQAIKAGALIENGIQASAKYNYANDPSNFPGKSERTILAGRKKAGMAAKKAWGQALDAVSNPPGKSLEDIKESAALKYAEKKRAEAAAAKINAAKQIPSTETKLRMGKRLQRLKELGLK